MFLVFRWYRLTSCTKILSNTRITMNARNISTCSSCCVKDYEGMYMWAVPDEHGQATAVNCHDRNCHFPGPVLEEESFVRSWRLSVFYGRPHPRTISTGRSSPPYDYYSVHCYRFNIILPCTPNYSKWTPTFRLSEKTCWNNFSFIQCVLRVSRISSYPNFV